MFLLLGHLPFKNVACHMTVNLFNQFVNYIMFETISHTLAHSIPLGNSVHLELHVCASSYVPTSAACIFINFNLL